MSQLEEKEGSGRNTRFEEKTKGINIGSEGAEGRGEKRPCRREKKWGSWGMSMDHHRR